MYANPFLSFVGFALLFFVESTETKVAQVTTLYITVDAGFPHDLVVLHQIVDLFFQCIGIVNTFTKLIEHRAPI